MHPNPRYRRADRKTALDVAARRGFGTIAINAEPVPLLAHVPFYLTEDRTEAHCHLMRSNPIARATAGGGLAAVLSVSGPDGYLSPDWYGLADQVPTWNYVAVHLRGRLAPLGAGRLRAVLDRLSASFEERLHPKPPWTSAKMDPAALDRMMRMVCAFRFEIAEVDSTFKLAQTKPRPARLAAADAMAAAPIGHEVADLAALMRDPPGDVDSATPTA